MGNAFLTGWSLPPSYFTTRDDTTVIDSTELIATLFDESSGDTTFNSSLLEWFQTNYSAIDSITGFSLGAILTIQLAQQIEFARITLLAPALTFISRAEHPSGIHPRILARMIRAIDTKCDIVLRDFDKNCGIEQPIERNYSKDSLKTGLQFLQWVNLPAVPLLGNPEITIVHGLNDQIIPLSSCEKVSLICNTVIDTTTGGHAAALK